MSAVVRLSRRLVLEARESVPDGSGGFAVAWARVGTMWADIEAQSGREVFAGGQPRSRVRYRIMVRAAPDGAPSRPRTEQRLREGGRVFDIVSVSEHDPAGRYLEILADEGVLP